MMKQRGFTLLELSIVLVIIGLLVGGVLVGRDMMRGSQSQAVVSEIEAIVAAMQNFQTKYKAIPGDMPNATDFWPQVSLGCTNQAGTNAQTCNGTGNERIGEDSAGEDYERFRIWQHMTLSGFYPGSFTGVAGPSSGYHMVADVNIPKSKVSYGVYSIMFSSVSLASNATALNSSTNLYFDAECRNCIKLGNSSGIGGNNGPAISPLEASLIDQKFDDGKAVSGIMTARKMSAGNCTTTLVATTAQYQSHNDITCVIFVRTGL